MSLSNIANPKSILAKLLAQENLIVEHKKTHTASFDPVNRVLTLPIWKEMSVDIYDLLVGHEVGHAWETPPQGWHTAIEKKGRGFKSFLNVVEDARIEKKIKNRYPGLRAPFYRGYRELFDSNFFGVDEDRVATLSLIDRLNLHFKIGSLLNVPFESNEKTYVDRMEKLDTWEDVYNLAEELYTYHKENPTTEFDDLDYEENGFGESEDDESDERSNNKLGSKGSRSGDEYDPQSHTDKAFRENEASLLSNDLHPYVYVNLPTANLDDAIIDHKVLYNGCDFSVWDNYSEYVVKHFNGQRDFTEKEKMVFDKGRLYNEYKEKNMKFIMYLVKEFELKRNASQYMRASVSKTGELDTNKVWSYKLKEDLFKRVTKLPNGKNHGMVMYVDWSGSMVNNITNTIEQTLILADFCKKVSIPFEVFAFSDNSFLRKLKYGTEDMSFRKNKFSKRHKEIAFEGHNVYLMNLLSNRMSKVEYRNAQHRLLQLGAAYDDSDFSSYEHRYSRSLRTNSVPKYLTLHGTPLDESIVLATYFIEKFKAANKLDVANTIFLTDGDGSETRCAWDNGLYKSFVSEAGSKLYNVVLKDVATGTTVTSKPNEPMAIALLKMLKAKTNTNLVGYFISGRSMKSTIYSMAQSYGQHVDIEQALKFARKNKYFGMDNTGYDKYFIVLGKDLEVQESKIDVKDDFNKRELLKAFVSNQKNKVLNRILLNKFIEQIA